MTDFRKEKDFLGEVEVPANAYYGVFTVRAKENFKISGINAPKKFIDALALLKKCCALANIELGTLDKKIGEAIVQAADEVLAGKHADQFPLDVYQAGAGTPYNMNMNEVLTNRALEILGHPRGEYKIIGPNNHPNASQSSNDVIPTATRISVVFAINETLPSLEKLENSLRKKSQEFMHLVKTGRTHHQDAVPITLGQEFLAYANKIEGARKYLIEASEKLKDLGIGGTAIGTGINTHEEFSVKTVAHLNDATNLGFTATKDKIDKTQNFDDFVAVSNALRIVCIDMLKISNDLKMLNSGPNAGIAEIILPEVEPGSSIMPGKVNPSVPECVDMVCFQVISRDQAVVLSAANGVLELNVYTPLIMYDLIDSLSIVKNTAEMFADKCIDGIIANEGKIKEHLDKGLIIGTALNPLFGYAQVAEWIKEAHKS
ncbi:aspartate ammonia-lyase, partial [Candidatus Micrarchaeota archaeon]|nr:aspartate ammonia-lyase [Candidatus Micrarchaeota archaeon]